MAEARTKKQSNETVLNRLYIACVLCGTFLVIELIGGYFAGSLAVLSDAAHLMADLCAFLVAIGASHLANYPVSFTHTYGLRRAESLAALLSMVSLALVSVGLAWEAMQRLVSPARVGVDGLLMSQIAAIGVGVNIILAIVLGPENHVHFGGAECSSHAKGGHDHSHDHHHHDAAEETTPLVESLSHDSHDTDPAHQLFGASNFASSVSPPPRDCDHDHARNVNLQAAYLHVLGDLAQSVGVLLSGLVIWFKPTWHLVDPIVTMVFCVFVFYSTLKVIRHSVAVLLEEVPPHLNWEEVYTALDSVQSVEHLHDMHIWSISDGIPALSVHCFSKDPEVALRKLYAICRAKGIQHATIQIQQSLSTNECVTCSTDPDHAHPELSMNN